MTWKKKDIIQQEITIPAADGFDLSCLLYPCKNQPRGFIQINSGTGIPKEFYGNFAAYCASMGFVTVTYDYRGIGGSKPKSLRGFEADNVEWGTLDASTVLQYGIENYPDLKKIIIGHSMGGQIIGLMENNQKIDQVVMIASGTGYWKDMPDSLLKSLMPFLWYVYIPFTVKLFGFANARKIRQGENLPKGVAMRWRNWCMNKDYWERDFGDTIDPNGFYDLGVPIHSIRFTDDTIISKTATEKLLGYYRNARITQTEIDPATFGLEKINHFGFFSRKSRELWDLAINQI